MSQSSEGALRIVLQKISDERHALELRREGGARERVVCETRSYLSHDLLHYALEGEAGLDSGFWGNLAQGRSLAEMNDRQRPMTPEMAPIERVVGMLSGLTRGMPPDELLSTIRSSSASSGSPLPSWLGPELVAAVAERLRRLQGQWRATPYGGSLELEWPPAPLRAEGTR